VAVVKENGRGRPRFFRGGVPLSVEAWRAPRTRRRAIRWASRASLRLDPQHPQQLGKYESKLRSDPQQSRNKGATGGATAARGKAPWGRHVYSSEWPSTPFQAPGKRHIDSGTLGGSKYAAPPELENVSVGNALLKARTFSNSVHLLFFSGARLDVGYF